MKAQKSRESCWNGSTGTRPTAFLWELPAGRIDEGERELAAAKRELLEETGYTARNWKRILHFYVSPGFLDETMSIYLARGLNAGVAQPEEDEKIAVRFFRFVGCCTHGTRRIDSGCQDHFGRFVACRSASSCSVANPRSVCDVQLALTVPQAAAQCVHNFADLSQFCHRLRRIRKKRGGTWNV